MTPPQTSSPEIQKCKELIRAKKAADAIELLQNLLKDDPKNEDALELLGMASFATRKYEAARDAFDRLTKADPMNLNGWVNLGAVCNRLGEHKRAIEALRRAVQRDRKCAEGYYNMGIAQKALNMNTMAISAYKEAIKLKPTLVEAHLNLGNIYAEMKNTGLAMQCFQNALKHDPNNEKAKASFDRVQTKQKIARKVDNPFGRLVDVKTLESRQGTSDRRVMDAIQRQEERELVQVVTKRIRSSAKEIVPILDDSLPAQLHRLERIVFQSETRLSSADQVEFFSQTMGDLHRLRVIVSEGLDEVRAHLAK